MIDVYHNSEMIRGEKKKHKGLWMKLASLTDRYPNASSIRKSIVVILDLL
jgi:hypothetical protein